MDINEAVLAAKVQESAQLEAEVTSSAQLAASAWIGPVIPEHDHITINGEIITVNGEGIWV